MIEGYRYLADMQKVSDLFIPLGFSIQETKIWPTYPDEDGYVKNLFDVDLKQELDSLRDKLDPARVRLYSYSGEFAIKIRKELFLCLRISKQGQYYLCFREKGLTGLPCLILNRDLSHEEIYKITEMLVEASKDINPSQYVEVKPFESTHVIESRPTPAPKPVAQITLSQEQENALNLMLKRNNVFLTGEAGTGKSTILREYRKRKDDTVAFLAPTGIAAINIKGSTIHSFLLLKPGLLTKDNLDPLQSKQRRKIIRHTKTIVIDEISMVRSDIFYAMDWRLRELASGSNAYKPFGGKQIIAVGDFFQLPPVVKDSNEEDYLIKKYGGIYCFETPLWEEAGFKSVVLKEIHRQSGERTFISILNDIRHNNLDEQNIDLGDGKMVDVITALNHKCIGKPPMNPKPVQLCTTNREAESYNAMCQSRLSGKETIFRAVVTGKFPEKDYPTQFTLNLQVGARVMVLVNKRSPDGNFLYVNGDMGTIESISGSSSPYVEVRFDNGSTQLIQPYTWTQYAYKLKEDPETKKTKLVQEESGKFVQMPLKLAYAITIHKSQGLSLDRVYIRLGNGCFAHGQLYTALSRCRSLENLQMERKIFREDVIVDRKVLDFYASLDSPKNNKAIESTKISVPKEYEAEVLEFIRSLQGKRYTNEPDIEHLMIVYHNQTADEKNEYRTEPRNGIGFNKYDAKILTEIAVSYLNKGFLSEAEMRIVRERIPKYHLQWES